MNQKKLDRKIDKLELDEMSTAEIERVVSAISQEGLDIRRKRKDVRYKLYRIQTETNGGAASQVDEDFKEKFEVQDMFEGWRLFGINWDVSMEDPYRVVHRVKSLSEEWDELIMAKFPRVEPGGKVTYQDINVRKKVEANATKAEKKAKKKTKKG